MAKSSAPKVKQAKVGPTFRVVKLGQVQRDQVRKARDIAGVTNQVFIEQAVEQQLPALLEELAAVGIEPLTDGGPCRLPFSDEALAKLKEASTIGVPAVMLLRIVLRRHADTIVKAAPAPKRRGRKAAPKKGGR